jgi:large subunit ribosomal protein L31
MKDTIHPNYQQITITCVGCGTTFTTGSTAKDARVDICSKCHPFFTGQKKLIDTEGRVEKFTKRVARQAEERKPKKVVVTAVPGKMAVQTAQKSADQPKSLRDMLQDAANTR